MKKNILNNILVPIMLLSMIVLFSACGFNDKDQQNNASDTSASEKEQIYTNADGKTQEELNAEDDNFYGSWTATSGSAQNLYGNLDMTINENGTFDGNVTGEDFSGTWKKIDEGISFESVYINGEMYFGERCRMVIYDDYSVPVTMKKVD
ncbi:MAG: hypothetical protein PHS19_01030 [Eubacteriales bacterium]|nr:hypothetical protein [Eubacteriales bacterium]